MLLQGAFQEEKREIWTPCHEVTLWGLRLTCLRGQPQLLGGIWQYRLAGTRAFHFSRCWKRTEPEYLDSDSNLSDKVSVSHVVGRKIENIAKLK